VQPLLYANLSKKTLSETQSGSSISWPRLVAGEDLVLKLRLVQSLDGQVIAARRTIRMLKASIGEKDARPLDGSFQIKLGTAPENAGVNTTAKIAHNATADQFAAALNALSDGALAAMQPFTCTLRDGSYLVRAAGGAQLMFTVTDNELWPVSFVTIREFSYDEGHSYEFRLTQAPVAETTGFNFIVPEIPSITTIQTGSENSGVKINEIQRLFVPPENPENFSFRLTFGFKKSDPIVLPTTAEEILDALAPLADADAGEEFRVYPGQDAVLIEFTGDAWAGSNQAPLGVQVIDEAPADPTFTISTATAEMAIRARRPDNLGEIKLPLELTLGLEDEQDELTIRTIKFRAELVFLVPVNQSAFSAAAALNWNQPLSRESYLQFSPSQVATGQRHYLITSLGDGASDEIEVNHNLNTRYLLVQLQQAAVDGLFLTHGTDYQVRIVSNNAIALIFPGGAPAAASLIGQISTASHDANFEPHTHTIAEIDGLEERLSAAEVALAELQTLAPSGSIASSANVSTAPSLDITLPSFVEACPALQPDLTSSTEIKSLADIPASSLPSNGGLLPAVHDVAVETLPGTIPAAADSYKGRVFRNAGANDVELDGGYGRKLVAIRPREYAACDGRSWYPVKRYDSPGAPVTMTIDINTDVCTAAAHPFSDGDAVMLATTGVLPTPALADTQYYVRDKTANTFKLAATPGGAAINFLIAPSGVQTIFTAPKSTFYPADFERELFVLPVKSKQFRIKQTLELFAGIEAALVNVKVAHPRTSDLRYRSQITKAQWSLVLRWGIATSESSPATTGANLKGITWNSTPIFEQRIDLVASPIVHTFGCRIKRTTESTFTVEEILYGRATASAASITTADFYLGAWLERFDTEDGVSDPRGLALLMGLTRSNSADPEANLGKLTIK
jgi:hypothetical protein